MSYLPYTTIVIYVTDNYATKWVEDFVKRHPKSIEHISKIYDEIRISLYDGSKILMFKHSDMCKEHRADRIYVENGVSQEDIDYIIRPCLCRSRLIIDDEIEL